jgi:hypothetical protein
LQKKAEKMKIPGGGEIKQLLTLRLSRFMIIEITFDYNPENGGSIYL